MANDKRNEDLGTEQPQPWEPPTLKYVGNVAEIFLFPGGGKLSTANYDTGDSPFKPKGQEDNPH
jgi:hypothetical protein